MRKNYSLILLAFLCASFSCFAQYDVDFEDDTKVAYASNTVTLNGINWDMTEALIGTTASDYKNALHSARFRGRNGSGITMLANKANGIGTISFEYRRFGTDGAQQPWAVEYSTNDGSSWTQIGSDFTATATVQVFSETVNVTGNIRVRIVIASTPGTSGNRRMNVDDISISDYTVVADPDLSITGTTDHGSSCLTTAASTIQYTITNNGTLTANGINVVSDDAQFVISNLSSTTIAPSGTATYDVTFTPSGTGTQGATITATSSTAGSNSPTSNVTGTGITVPSITTQPANQSVSQPNTASFSIASSDATSYQWEVSTNGGTIWNNVTGGTGATTDTYTTGATAVAMDGDLYRCIATNTCGSTTSNSAMLTVTILADVVITEIMYNPPAANDYEWIEICNLNGTAQDVSDYTIDVNGTTRFTFPSTTTIPANTCITVLLGHLGSSPAPECPFTPDYSNPVGTTNFLINGGATITLESPANDVIDLVAYDDADSNATDGNGSSFHVIDATADNSDTDTNWQAVLTGGSPGDNTLVSPCTVPEIQLVDDSNTDQACGAFVMAFGSQATGFDTDITFDIDNDGALGLTVSSFAITGAASGDFSIVSPATPFVVAAGNTQTVTVRFTPSVIGFRNATLTINNDDSDESACTITLQGTGASPAPEINVEGDIGAFPDIADGDLTPSGTDNTLFAAQFIGSSQEKTFRIQNIGTDVLNISNITVGGTNPGDFTITVAPASSVAISNLTVFEVSFSPLAAGIRQADIIITNNDGDENPYNFRVQGTGNCVANAITLSPNSGPEGTIVTVTGTDLSTATATFNGLAATVNNISSTVMEVTVPNGALTGNLEITDDLGCPGNAAFTVIDTQIGTCEGGSALGELFISEVTDATYGSLTYIEIYNATGANVNLASYEVRVYANGSTSSFTSQTLSGTINAGDTFVLTTGTSGVLGSSLCATPGGDGSYGDLVSSTLAGVNVVNNEHDFIGLYNSGTLIDAFGEFGVDNWLNSTSITGDRGFNFRRLNTATPIPTTTFNTGDWNIIDWAGSGSATCVSTNDYSDIGVYDFSTGTPPLITAQPSLPSTDCNLTVSLSVTANEGFSGGNSLAYQWYFAAQGDLNWTAITNGATYSGATLATLNILDPFNLDGYQYYCQVREDDATCYTASNAIKLDIPRTIWDGTNWSSVPAIDKVAVIDGDYDTSIGTNGQTSFEACILIINATHTLTISNGTYVEVENDLTVDGNILIETDGAFVQNNDSGVVDGAVTSDKTRSTVEKETAILNSYQEYTYWSSPVFGEIISDGLSEASSVRRFWYNGQNFRDSFQETNNDNTAVAGQDDIDDDANDWQTAGAAMVMAPGIGYASTHNALGYVGVAQYKYTFEGPFNNGVYNIPIYRNDAETNDNNWNFIGNPYPSAIDADLFLTANASIDQTVGATNGAIFFWSHNTPADGNTNGNEVLNYSQSDYAIINGTGQTAGGDGVVPDRFIPSGQGFFVSMSDASPSTIVSGSIRTTDVVFNNSMRVTGNNSQFFRTTSASIFNKIRLDLTSDNGVFNQILVGYVDGATNDDDGMYYDAHKNLSANANAVFYSLIDSSSDKKFAIQGKATNTLTIEEVVPLGFYTTIDEATLYTISIAELQGDFMNNNTVYLKDNLLDITHDLSTNDYVFTSEVGEFNSRFEIVFQPEALSVNENDIDPNNFTIVELNDGDVKFSVGNALLIQHVEILDAIGRVIYQLKGNNNVETYNLSRLSQSTYIARVTLSNGQVITKKAVKRK
ncbi:choice-of-anchor D domain-containing protein [uncultured Psychroserpens sp.]|uniref:choice-of-anchor D domain-containing protein n=1 Tax=uncultured Psychroserpens sp. TaxID=255436 RepID=UPI00262765F0|nr:choice-of-anchor D domain-containing protein [uncultured Psychroserpens sp.]